MNKRKRSVPHTFKQNIAREIAKLEAQLATLKPGPEQEALQSKITQLETAIDVDDWLRSPGEKAPE